MRNINKVLPFLFVILSLPAVGNELEVRQHDGFDISEYVFYPQKNALLKKAPDTDSYKKVADAPSNIIAMVPFGQSDIALFAENGTAYCYNTITSTIRPLKFPDTFSFDPDSIPSSEKILELLEPVKPHFGAVNYSVLGIYLASLLAMGFYFSKFEKSTNDFFLAGQRIPWWAAGLSIFGTQLSAITFMAIPAKTYSSDWQYLLQNMGIAFVAIPVAIWVFVPFYRRLNVSTAYEYLEKRFDVKVRLLASFIYVVMQLMRMGIVIFLPSLALTTVTGINVQTCILIMGVLCTIYTVMGGIEAVIWTDVLQVIVLLGGAIICIAIILFDLGSELPEMTANAWNNSKFTIASIDFDLTKPTLIVVFLSVFSVVVPYVSDQTVIQRYLTTKDEKATKNSLWANAVITIPAAFLFFGLGTLLYMFFKKNPSFLEAGMSNDSVFPWFILNHLPKGVSGLLIAGIFAAAMSSLDSSMNSGASAIINDFIIRFNDKIKERKRLFYSRMLTVLLGIFGTGTAIVMSVYNIKSIWDYCTMVIGLVSGGLFAAFLLAAFTTRVNSTGTIVGIIVCTIVMLFVKYNTDLHFFLFSALSVIITSFVAYPVSLLTGGNNKNLTGLTIHTMN